MSLLMWNSNLQRITFAIINVLQMFIYGLTQYFFGDVIIFLLMLLFLKLGVENLFTFAKSTFCSNILLNMVLMLLFACCMLKKNLI